MRRAQMAMAALCNTLFVVVCNTLFVVVCNTLFVVVCNTLFVVVFLAFIAKIVMRYAMGDALAWADELCVVLFIWIIFLANAFLVADRQQIRFDLLEHRLPPRARRVAIMARTLLIGFIIAWSLPGAIGYIRFLWRERTPVMLWRLDYVYACFGIFLVAVLARLAWRLVTLALPGWRDRLSS